MTATDSNMGFRQRLLEIIDHSGTSDRRLSLAATGSADTVRNIRRGSSPRLNSLEALCRVLGLQLQTVPLNELAKPLNAPPAEAERPEWSRRLREEIRQDLVEILDRSASSRSVAGTCQVETGDLAASGGAIDLRATIVGHVSFSRRWFDCHGLVPALCYVISVIGKSMEPTLPEGASLLVDRASTHRADGRIYLIRTPHGLVVKRVSKDQGGCWWLISDHSGWKPVRWPCGAEIVGEVRWGGKGLVTLVRNKKRGPSR